MNKSKQALDRLVVAVFKSKPPSEITAAYEYVLSLMQPVSLPTSEAHEAYAQEILRNSRENSESNPIEPPTPKWQEQWDELNRFDNPYWYMTKTKRTGNWEFYTTENTFTADTPETAIDAAYTAIIGSGVQS